MDGCGFESHLRQLIQFGRVVLCCFVFLLCCLVFLSISWMIKVLSLYLVSLLSQPQSHGKIVRKLSRRLKVGTRKVTPPSSEIIPIRPSSPVLIPSNPLPTHFSPLLEEDTGRCVCVCVCGGGGGGGGRG